MANMQEVRRFIEDINRAFIVWKQQLAILIFFVATVIVYNSVSSQHHEIRMIRNSISNFYRDFDVSMLKNPSELKDLMARATELSGVFTTLEEIQRASDENDKQIDILKNFEHDKTGKLDLALSDVGGRIAGIGSDTQTFYSCNAIMKLFNCPARILGPENAITSSTMPGNCFGFKGEKGSLFVALVTPAVVDAFTIEHIKKNMSPTGDVSDAPRVFNVVGFNSPKETPHNFGTFEFNVDKVSIKTFTVQNRLIKPVRFIGFQFEKNNGNPQRTCVYRVRVHGVIDQI